jgi:hypothetical protein
VDVLFEMSFARLDNETGKATPAWGAGWVVESQGLTVAPVPTEFEVRGAGHEL